MRKDSQLSVRITEQEMTNLREQANRESVLLSQLVRCILAANNKQTGITSLFRRLTTSRPTTTPARNLRGPDPALLSGRTPSPDYHR